MWRLADLYGLGLERTYRMSADEEGRVKRRRRGTIPPGGKQSRQVAGSPQGAAAADTGRLSPSMSSDESAVEGAVEQQGHVDKDIQLLAAELQRQNRDEKNLSARRVLERVISKAAQEPGPRLKSLRAKNEEKQDKKEAVAFFSGEAWRANKWGRKERTIEKTLPLDFNKSAPYIQDVLIKHIGDSYTNEEVHQVRVKEAEALRQIIQESMQAAYKKLSDKKVEDDDVGSSTNPYTQGMAIMEMHAINYDWSLAAQNEAFTHPEHSFDKFKDGGNAPSLNKLEKADIELKSGQRLSVQDRASREKRRRRSEAVRRAAFEGWRSVYKDLHNTLEKEGEQWCTGSGIVDKKVAEQTLAYAKFGATPNGILPTSETPGTAVKYGSELGSIADKDKWQAPHPRPVNEWEGGHESGTLVMPHLGVIRSFLIDVETLSDSGTACSLSGEAVSLELGDAPTLGAINLPPSIINQRELAIMAGLSKENGLVKATRQNVRLPNPTPTPEKRRASALRHGMKQGDLKKLQGVLQSNALSTPPDAGLAGILKKEKRSRKEYLDSKIKPIRDFLTEKKGRYRKDKASAWQRGAAYLAIAEMVHTGVIEGIRVTSFDDKVWKKKVEEERLRRLAEVPAAKRPRVAGSQFRGAELAAARIASGAVAAAVPAGSSRAALAKERVEKKRKRQVD